MNPLLQLSKEQFIERKLNKHHEIPPYFRKMEKYNVEGAPFIGVGPKPIVLSPRAFQDKMNEGAIVIDIRTPIAFNNAHIKGSFSIPRERLSHAGWVIPYNTPILSIVNTKSDLDYTALSLARIGYDKIVGYLGKGLSSW